MKAREKKKTAPRLTLKQSWDHVYTTDLYIWKNLCLMLWLPDPDLTKCVQSKRSYNSHQLHTIKCVRISWLDHFSHFEPSLCHPAHLSQLLLLQAQVLLRWLTHGSKSVLSFSPETSLSVSFVSPGLSLIPFQPPHWMQLPSAPHWNWMSWRLVQMVNNCPCNVHKTMKLTRLDLILQQQHMVGFLNVSID